MSLSTRTTTCWLTPIALAMTLVTGLAYVKSAPPKGGDSSSRIYFWYNGDGQGPAIWMMSSSGSNKTQVSPGNINYTTASEGLAYPTSRTYGETRTRWWLQFGTDDETGATEIFAFREADPTGPRMQLTRLAPDGVLLNQIAFQDPPRWSNDGLDTFVSVHVYAKFNPEWDWGAYLVRLPIIGDIDLMQAAGALPLSAADCEVILPPRYDPLDDNARLFPRQYCWSNQPEQLCYIGEGGLWICQLPTQPDETALHVPVYATARMSRPVWSPDGTRIGFSTGNTSSTWGGVWTVRPDGTGAVQLVKNSGTTSYELHHWSPDSQQLLMVKTVSRLGRWEYNLAKISADGRGLAVLTSDLTPTQKGPLGWVSLP